MPQELNLKWTTRIHRRDDWFRKSIGSHVRETVATSIPLILFPRYASREPLVGALYTRKKGVRWGVSYLSSALRLRVAFAATIVAYARSRFRKRQTARETPSGALMRALTLPGLRFSSASPLPELARRVRFDPRLPGQLSDNETFMSVYCSTVEEDR